MSYLSQQQPTDADEKASFFHPGARGSCEPGPSASLGTAKAGILENWPMHFSLLGEISIK